MLHLIILIFQIKIKVKIFQFCAVFLTHILNIRPYFTKKTSLFGDKKFYMMRGERRHVSYYWFLFTKHAPCYKITVSRGKGEQSVNFSFRTSAHFHLAHLRQVI